MYPNHNNQPNQQNAQQASANSSRSGRTVVPEAKGALNQMKYVFFLDLGFNLNLVYIGFYDSSDNLIGVWHFTKNAPMDGSDSKSFSIHMKELPIDGLAEKAVSVKVIGIGF